MANIKTTKIESPFIVSINKKKIVFLLIAILILIWSFMSPPKRNADGLEYLAMTVSFANHFTPELTELDRNISQSIASANNDKLNSEFPGYYQDKKSRYYSFHFWFYSLLCTPVYMILKIFNLNLLSSFQITNCLLFLFAFYWTLFVSKLSDNLKIWLSSSLIFNPIVLYFNYTNPEVYSYVILYISLLAWLDEKRTLACALSAIASFQNPAIAIITAYFGLKEIIKSIKLKKVQINFLWTFFSCSSVLFPYLWFYWHYSVFSLIGEKATNGISLDRALNLLFDLNMGLFLYIPLLLLVLMFLVYKKDIQAINFIVLIFLVALVCSAQVNWNSAMAYINRYAVWMIPLAIVGSLSFITKLSRQRLIIFLVAFIFSTGSITVYCIATYKQFNYMLFSSVAKFVMAKTPALYNPPDELFIERIIGEEIGPNDAKKYLPIGVSNESGIRKILTVEDGKIKYQNGRVVLSGQNFVHSLGTSTANNSIFKFSGMQFFDSGWTGMELNKELFRWSKQQSNTYFSTGKKEKVYITLDIASYRKNRDCEIRLNDQLVFKDVIPIDHRKVRFEADLYMFNKLTIIANDDNNGGDLDIRFNVKNIELAKN
ncbi:MULTISPECIES: hypothetical protein [unclassified Paenibacillus]|uniref:hypothetical protein n=1 Tax=unclassified Paenibacillus TaxID=185978 RepID=UPI0036323B8D